jgi:hypothetical protein
MGHDGRDRSITAPVDGYHDVFHGVILAFDGDAADDRQLVVANAAGRLANRVGVQLRYTDDHGPNLGCESG